MTEDSPDSGPSPASAPPPPLFSSSPPRPPSAKTISSWPSSILLDIFLFAAQPSPDDSAQFAEQATEDVVGGQLSRWRAHTCLKPLLLVSRGWHDAGTLLSFLLGVSFADLRLVSLFRPSSPSPFSPVRPSSSFLTLPYPLSLLCSRHRALPLGRYQFDTRCRPFPRNPLEKPLPPAKGQAPLYRIHLRCSP
jgi:hypothetical protein